MKGTDVVNYTRRFQELALLCPAMVTSENKRIEIYIQGLSPQIQEGVTSFDPKTIQAAIRMVHKLIDQIVLQETIVENAKGKQDENRGKDIMQYKNKKQKIGHTEMECRNIAPIEKVVTPGACYKCGEVEHLRNNCPKLKESILKKTQGKAYMKVPKEVVRINDTGEGYKGNHPYCAKCGGHHIGCCTIICNICKKVGHMARDCKIAAPVPITTMPMTCYEYGTIGHFKKTCPKLKEQTLKQPKEEPM